MDNDYHHQHADARLSGIQNGDIHNTGVDTAPLFLFGPFVPCFVILGAVLLYFRAAKSVVRQ